MSLASSERVPLPKLVLDEPASNCVNLPVASATSLLLDALWVSVDVARLGEIARKVIFGYSSAVSESSVVSIVVLDSSSH